MEKKIRYLILILILFFLILIIRSTYSKYANYVDTNASQRIGEWIIKVNGKDITPEDNTEEVPIAPVEFEIGEDDFYWSEAENVEEGKVAPGMNGYFKITIDPNGTDTSLEYTIDIDQTELKAQGISLGITEILEDNGRTLDVSGLDSNNIIVKRIVRLDEIQAGNIDVVTVNMDWPDENSEADSELGSIQNTTISLPVKVQVLQYTGV